MLCCAVCLPGTVEGQSCEGLLRQCAQPLETITPKALDGRGTRGGTQPASTERTIKGRRTNKPSALIRDSFLLDAQCIFWVMGSGLISFVSRWGGLAWLEPSRVGSCCRDSICDGDDYADSTRFSRLDLPGHFHLRSVERRTFLLRLPV